MATNSKAYMREYYRLKRAEVVSLLGSRCALCSSTCDLEIDHVLGYSGKFSPNGSRGGMRNLWHALQLIRQGRASELRLLCKKCNASLGGSKDASKSSAIPLLPGPATRPRHSPFSLIATALSRLPG